jgi:selenocysteine lyase/cysteine desulfurase
VSAPAASLAPREHFPLLEEVTYLNAASMGLVPLPMQEQAAAFDRELALRGTTWFDEEQEIFALERARAAAATLLNAPPEAIAIATSMSEALNQVAWWLRPSMGTNIVTIDLECDHRSRVSQRRLPLVSRGPGDWRRSPPCAGPRRSRRALHCSAGRIGR